MDMRPLTFTAITCIAFAEASLCFAGDHTPAHASETPYSTTLYGPLGLNTVPSARVDPVGTVRAQISTLDPYAHASLGVQIAKPLYINLRQTAEVSDITEAIPSFYYTLGRL